MPCGTLAAAPATTGREAGSSPPGAAGPGAPHSTMWKRWSHRAADELQLVPEATPSWVSNRKAEMRALGVPVRPELDDLHVPDSAPVPALTSAYSAIRHREPAVPLSHAVVCAAHRLRCDIRLFGTPSANRSSAAATPQIDHSVAPSGTLPTLGGRVVDQPSAARTSVSGPGVDGGCVQASARMAGDGQQPVGHRDLSADDRCGLLTGCLAARPRPFPSP